MKLAIVGSRTINNIKLDEFIPKNVTTIISGGAMGVDTLARNYARKHGLKLIEYFPDYEKYGKIAPLKRNILIIEEADCVLACWDEKSRGTKFVIDECQKRNIRVRVVTRIKK